MQAPSVLWNTSSNSQRPLPVKYWVASISTENASAVRNRIPSFRNFWNNKYVYPKYCNEQFSPLTQYINFLSFSFLNISSNIAEPIIVTTRVSNGWIYRITESSLIPIYDSTNINIKETGRCIIYMKSESLSPICLCLNSLFLSEKLQVQ